MSVHNTNVSNQTLGEIDRASLIHPFTVLKPFTAGEMGEPRVIAGGKGVFLRDNNGNEVLDAFAGLYCVNVGYGRPEMAEAIYEQAKKLAYCHIYAGQSHEPAILLAKRVLDIAGMNMSHVFFGLSGSDANETQAKIVWYYNNVLGRTKKKKIISRHRGYHGGTVISGSMTGLPFYHTAFDLPVGGILHTTNPHHYWEAEAGMSERDFSRKCAADLEAMIEREGPETVAAFIGEPVLGTGGIIPPPEGYWEEIQNVLAKYDILLIADEVICAFGRTGADFGSHLYGMKPDLVTIAKGLTSAYIPLSASIVGERVWKVLEQGSDKFGSFSHGYTYSAHPIAAAAGLANLDIVTREDLPGNARDTGAYFQQRLIETFASHPMVGEVRGVGLMAAIEFVADRHKKQRFAPALKVGAQLSAACYENGLISRAMPHGDILGFSPPLVVNRNEIDQIIDRTKRAVEKVADTLTRDGAWRS